MSKSCDCCVNINISRRDFRNAADGPEEMPHRKAGKKKGRGTKRVDHKHLWETNGWEKKYATKYVRFDKPDVFGYFWRVVEDQTRWYFVRKYECLECGKKGKTDYDYPKGRRFFYYGW